MQRSSHSDASVTGIHVTPLVDAVLVLLVVSMVTATYLAARGLPAELPKGEAGEASAAPITLSLTKTGSLFVDGVPCDEQQLRERLSEARRTEPALRAVIAADGAVPHQRVIGILEVLRQEHVDRFSVNVNADELSPP